MENFNRTLQVCCSSRGRSFTKSIHRGNAMGCLPLGSKFPVNFNWEWRFSTYLFRFAVPEGRSCTRSQVKCNLIGCLPSGSKFPVNFNWEWSFSTESLSRYLSSSKFPVISKLECEFQQASRKESNFSVC